jgi:hypothetical protein
MVVFQEMKLENEEKKGIKVIKVIMTKKKRRQVNYDI